jgi:hypothetical protein
MKEPVGVKYDEGKPRWDLLPLDVLEQSVRVLTMGADKYGAHNWKHVPDWNNRYFAAAMRHLTAYRSGDLVDDESGLPHLAHAITNLIFMLYLSEQETS